MASSTTIPSTRMNANSEIRLIVIPNNGITKNVPRKETGIPMLTHIAREGLRNSVRITNFLSKEQQQFIVNETKVGGATLTKLLGTSAWYAPGAAVSSLVHSIACDHKKMFPCSALLNGEYGLNDLCIGVPVILGKKGIEDIVEISLSKDEVQKLSDSAESVKTTNALLQDLI